MAISTDIASDTIIPPPEDQEELPFDPETSLKITIGGPRPIAQDITEDDDDIEGRYGATRIATEELDAIEELEAEFGDELDAEEEGLAPPPPVPPPPTEEGGVSIGKVLFDIGHGIIELPMQTAGGVRDAAQETLEAMDSLAIWLNNNVADLTVFDPETAPRFDFPEIPEAQSVTGGVERGIIQFIAGMVGAGKITRLSKLKNLSRAGEAGRLGIQGALADAIARDPNEQNLANLVRDFTGEQKSAVLNFLAADPDDSEAVARLKKALEGFGVGAVIDGLILSLGAVRATRALRQADEAAKIETAKIPEGEVAEVGEVAPVPVVSTAKRAVGESPDFFHVTPSKFDEFILGDLRGAGGNFQGKGIYLAEDAATVQFYEKLFKAEGQTPHRLGVKITTGIKDFLDFDTPINKQSPHVQKAISELLVDSKKIASIKGEIDSIKKSVAEGNPPPNANTAIQLLEESLEVAIKPTVPIGKGRDIWNRLVDRFGSVDAASKALDEAGIPGAKFLEFDAPRTTSFVVYNPQNVQILSRDGIPISPKAEPPVKPKPLPTARPLIGDPDKPLVETAKGATPQQFLDQTGILPDKAININLGKLDTTDDIKRAIDETAKLFKGEIKEARRGIQTNEATERLASDMGLTVEQLLKRRKGEAFNAETAVAARRMLASSASQLIDLAKKAADNGGDRELLAFRRAMALHAAIQQQVSGLTAEAGRALQSFKILVGPEREMIRNVQEMIDAAGGSRMSRKMAERLAAATKDGTLTRAQLNEVVRKGALTRSSDAFLEVWINGLLSGPQTQAVNILSNTLVSAWQIPTRFVASKLPSGSADAVVAGETKALLYGMLKGYSEGLILAGRVLRTGESTDILSKVDLPQRRAISAEAFNMSGTPGRAVDLLGEFVRLPGRALLAGDELFKAVGYRMELNARAFRQAASEGLEGDAMAKRMDEITRNPPDDLKLSAIDAGRYQTFTKPLGEGGQAFMSMVNAVPIMRLITPFIRTPVNIMKFVGEGTALAPLSRNVRAEIAAGGARQQMALSKIAMGSMASAWAADMASRGLLTGNGPSDPGTRKVWLQTHQANSIRVGDQWVAYGRLEPLGAFFGIAADAQMIMGDLDDPDRQDLATAIVIGIGRNVTSKTFLRGLSEAVNVLGDPDRFGERYIQQFAGTAVPSVVAQVTRAGIPGIVEGDPVLRDVRSIYDKLASRIPGLSTTLPPRRNVWGEVISLGGGIGPDIMSPVYTNKIKLDPVSDEILRLGVGVTLPSRQILGVELTPQEYDEYTRIAGEAAKKDLEKLIKRRDYKRASDGPDGLKAFAIRQVFAASRAVARAKMLKNKEFRDLRDRVEGRDAERRRSLRTTVRPPTQGDIQLPRTSP